MKEVETEYKNATIGVDFDGVVHRYSQGFQGLENTYDPPMPGAFEALVTLKEMGYRLIIVSSRPIAPIRSWLQKYEMEHLFDDVSNVKHPAKYYIDDHAIRFEKHRPNAWEEVLKFIKDEGEYNE